MLTTRLILAQSNGPSWLNGAVDVPFPLVGALLGLGIMAALLYYARRASQSRDEKLSDREHDLR